MRSCVPAAPEGTWRDGRGPIFRIWSRERSSRLLPFLFMARSLPVSGFLFGLSVESCGCLKRYWGGTKQHLPYRAYPAFFRSERLQGCPEDWGMATDNRRLNQESRQKNSVGFSDLDGDRVIPRSRFWPDCGADRHPCRDSRPFRS